MLALINVQLGVGVLVASEDEVADHVTARSLLDSDGEDDGQGNENEDGSQSADHEFFTHL